jgi:hypothetical protein
MLSIICIINFEQLETKDVVWHGIILSYKHQSVKKDNTCLAFISNWINRTKRKPSRKFKQWWETINSRMNSPNTKKATTHDIGNPGPGLRPAQKCGGVKSVCFVVWWQEKGALPFIVEAMRRYFKRISWTKHVVVSS